MAAPSLVSLLKTEGFPSNVLASCSCLYFLENASKWERRPNPNTSALDFEKGRLELNTLLLL